MGMFGDETTELRAYRVALNNEMMYAAWYADSYWNRHMGFIKSDGQYPKSVQLGAGETKRLEPTGKSIEVLTNFMHDGGDAMDLPVLNPLTNLPHFDTTMIGNEEERFMTYMTTHLWIYRHSVIVEDTKMGTQKLQEMAWKKRLMKGAKQDLTNYFSRAINFQPYNALLYKYSDNLFLPKEVKGGRGLTPVSHPNFYVAGYGRASWNTSTQTWTNAPGTAGYETDVATALADLNNDASKRMSAKMIRQIVTLATQLKIQPNISYKGRKLYSIVISQAAANDLAADAEYKKDRAFADMGAGDDAKNVSGQIEGIYYNAMISVDQNIPTAKITGDYGYDSTYTVSYANCQSSTTNYILTPFDTGNRKLAILHGASCVGAAYAQALEFESEYRDYKYTKSEEARMMVGFERFDVTDYDGHYGTAGLVKENTSSLVFAHWGDDNVFTM
jgi:hypothetical protein